MGIALWMIIISLAISDEISWGLVACYFFYRLVKKVLAVLDAYPLSWVWEAITLMITIIVWVL